MKKKLETMYILTPDSYLYHRNENICVAIGGQEKASVPAKDVDSIVFFGKIPYLLRCSVFAVNERLHSHF